MSADLCDPAAFWRAVAILQALAFSAAGLMVAVALRGNR